MAEQPPTVCTCTCGDWDDEELALTLLLRVPLFAACVGLIACLAYFAVLACVSFAHAAVPIVMQYLPWLGCGLRCARVRRRFEARGLPAQVGEANEGEVRAWACVRSGWVVREP